MTTIYLFPDFIGHPINFTRCFNVLRKHADVHCLNYSELWPYVGIDDLVFKVKCNILASPTIFIAFSFGGLVAESLRKAYPIDFNDTFLLCIDTKVTTNVFRDDLHSLFNSYLDFVGNREVIEFLIENNEINLDAIIHNMEIYRGIKSLSINGNCLYLNSITNITKQIPPLLGHNTTTHDIDEDHHKILMSNAFLSNLEDYLQHIWRYHESESLHKKIS
jgi:hypothetical protein